MKTFHTILLFILLTILFACSKKEVVEPDKMSDFFVMKPGYWWVYNMYMIDSTGKKGELLIDSMSIIEAKEIEGRKCFVSQDLMDIAGITQTFNSYLYADDSIAGFYELVGPGEKRVWIDIANIKLNEFKSGPYEMDLNSFFLWDPNYGFKGKWYVESRKIGIKDTIISDQKVKMMELELRYLYDGILRFAGEEKPTKLETRAIFYVGKGVGNIRQQIYPTKDLDGKFITRGYDIQLVKFNTSEKK